MLAGALIWAAPGISPARAQVPAAPTIGTVVAGDTALTLAWSAPAGVSEADIAEYDVRYIESSASDTDKGIDSNWSQVEAIWSGGSLHAIVDGLTNGTAYDVQMRAVTTIYGTWSATAEGTPREPGSSRTASSASRISVNLPIRGVIDGSADVDMYRIDLSAQQEVIIMSQGITDVAAVLYQGNTEIGRNSDAGLSSGPTNFALSGHLGRATYYLEVSGQSSSVLGPYTVHALAASDSTSTTQATGIELNTSIVALASHSGDVDYFEFELASTTTVSVRSAGYVDDTEGSILDSDDNVVASNDDSALALANTQFALRATLDAGTYYIKVNPRLSAAGSSGPYWLHFYEAPAAASSRAAANSIELSQTTGGRISASDATQYFAFTLAVPAGVIVSGSSESFKITGSLENDGGSTLDVHTYQYEFVKGTTKFADHFLIQASLEAGTYYIKVEADAQATTDEGDYLLVLRAQGLQDWLGRLCPNTSDSMGVNDSLYGCQWNLKNTGQFGGTAGEDINIEGAWAVTRGAGVNVAVVDDGLDFNHEDLAANVVLSANHDYYSLASVFSPSLNHGTSVTGTIAARANNIGTRGVAPEANVYAYNLLYQDSVDAIDMADSASRNRTTTSVHVNSWGPVSGPGADRATSLWERAVASGLSEGSGGHGVVYVFAAGNGDRRGDYSTLDEYAATYGVMAVCAVDRHGKRSSYSERGPNLWVCAPSDTRQAAPVDIAALANHSTYRRDFGGTSAATPTVAGVAALVRAVDPTLSWRDVQLIIAGSARQNDASHSSWEQGALKHASATERYSHSYGFGVVDATAAVELAQTWSKVSSGHTASAVYPTAHTVADSSQRSSAKTMHSDFDFVQFVELTVDMDAPTFRNLRIELESPSGAISTLSEPHTARCTGLSPCELNGTFRFGSARHLGEDPNGTWTLRLSDEVAGGGSNTLKYWDLTVFGHRQAPGAPTLGYVRPGSGSLEVLWDEPVEAGATAITGYQVRHIASGAADRSDSEWTVIESDCTAASCTATIGSLADGVSRDVQVRALSLRVGPWSNAEAGTPGASNSEPFFVDGERATRVIEENSAAGAAVGAAVAASDYESRVLDEALSYTLGGSDAASFAIDEATGQITAVVSLNAEERSTHSLEVSVSDNKDGDGNADASVDDTIEVDVEVGDIDEPPVIFGCVDNLGCSAVTGTDRLDYDEETTGIITQYIFTDPDSETVYFSFSGDDVDRFTLSDTWELSFGSRPDFEAPLDLDEDNTYEATLSVYDSLNTVIIDIEVTVNPVNEAPVLRVPQSRSFNENSSEDVLTVDVDDPEDDDIAWSLYGADSALFDIVGGVLRFKTPPDFENPRAANGGNRYSLNVQAHDGEISARELLAVLVTDVNEAPRVSGPPSHNIVENGGSAVGQYTADDPDAGDSVRWSLSGDDADVLVIDSVNGALEFVDPPDFEAPVDRGRNNAYAVRVVAGDGDLNDEFAVTVTVTNADEPGSVTFGSQPQAGTPVQATLADPDGGVSSVGWGWERSTTQSGPWSSVSGASASSYEPADGDVGYWLRATASYRDRHGPNKSASASSANAVLAAPVGNRAPEFPATETGQRSVDENTAAGVVVGVAVAAVDPDSDVLTYSLAGADATAFDVDAASGQLVTSAGLDHERRATYQVTVIARDPSLLTARRSVTITVIDVNEPPVVSGDSGPSLRENSAVAVGRYTADDPERAPLTWSLGGPDGTAFEFDADSGMLSFKEPPDHETPLDSGGDNRYEVHVTADDGSRRGTLEVTVTVNDVNEPAVVSGPDAVEWTEHERGPVGFYSADDPEGVTVTWRLGGADAADFAINDNGRLEFVSPPDYEAPADSDRRNDYIVIVIADDGEQQGTFEATVTVGDVNELGELRGLASPRVGTTLTATLTDPDRPITDQTWEWWRSDDPGDSQSWGQIDNATARRYRPAAADLGYTLRVEVTYDDPHGTWTLTDTSPLPVEPSVTTTRPSTTPGGPPGPTARPSATPGGGGGGGDFDVGVAVFVVANGWSSADVGVAAVAAARDPDAVVLYTAADTLSLAAATLMRDASPAEVVIVGGIAAVSRDVRTQIRAASPQTDVTRITGADRADTAAQTARRALGAPASASAVTVIVANGWSPPDIGAAAALAARSSRSAVLYTTRDGLPDPTASLLRDFRIARVVLVGGTAAISDDTRNAIAAAAPDAAITRLSGTDRIDTAAQTARRVLGNPAAAPDGVTLIIANGWSPPDIGVAAALAAATPNAAVAYTAPDRLPTATRALIGDYRPANVILIGGTIAISNNVRAAITSTALDTTTTRRITGATRTDTAAAAARRTLANR